MDDKTFNDLYKRYARSLRSYLINQCHIPESEVKDLMQDIFEEFLKKSPQVKAKYSEPALLFLITKNVIYNYYQKRSNNNRFTNVNFGEDEENDISATEAAICNAKFQQESHDLEIQLCLEQVFAQLEDNSDIYLLNCLLIHELIVAGHSTENIATKIDRTPGAIRQHISKCRKKLMQHPSLQECWDNGST
jgi:RNA polymerase sigma factor (sigma-70 family)